MAAAQMYEGTVEEIAEQMRKGNLAGRYRAILVPEIEGEQNITEHQEQTLLERLNGRTGRFDFGDANLSEDTGRKFAELLVEKHKRKNR